MIDRMAALAAAPASLRNNQLAILAMLAGIAVIVINDTLIKLAGATMPLGEMMFLRGVLCSASLFALVVAFGQLRPLASLVSAPMVLRIAGEVGGTLTYLTAILNMPLGLANAIFQITPLFVTGGSALFLGERVGWRRWSATAVGFIGALMIIQPGTASFSVYGFLVILCALLIAMRDLATRRIAADIPAFLLSLISAAAVMLTGLVLGLSETWHWPSANEALLLTGAAVFLSAGYVLMTIAVRIGEMSVAAPFRYSVVIFGLTAGWLVWNELPNLLAAFGIVVVVAAGLYTYLRERDRARREAQRQ